MENPESKVPYFFPEYKQATVTHVLHIGTYVVYLRRSRYIYIELLIIELDKRVQALVK